MSDPAFKFTDASNSVVSRTWPDGRCQSCSIEATEYKDWVTLGNTPLPADPPQPAVPDPLAVLTQAVKDKTGLTDADLQAAAAKVVAAHAATVPQ